MPSKDRDVDPDGRPREKRPRSKSERNKADRDGHRSHKSMSKTKSKMSDSESNLPSSSSHRRHRPRDDKKDRPSSMTDLVPELTGRTVGSAERICLPYPSFSKAHSKESIHSREDVSSAVRKTDPLTPEHTDLGAREKRRSKSVDFSADRKTSTSRKVERPPSPPDTDLTAQKARSQTPESVRRDPLVRPKSRVSELSKPASRVEERSRVSAKSRSSSQATYVQAPTPKLPPTQEAMPPSNDTGAPSRSSSKRGKAARNEAGTEPNNDNDSSPESAQDSSPKTPTQTPKFPHPPPPIFPNMKPDVPRPIHFQDPEFRMTSQAPRRDTSSTVPPTPGPPPPPPPPPPMLDIQEAPRVDYLLQNGGMPQTLPKHFLSVLPRHSGSRPTNPPLAGAETLFAPFFNLLEQYQSVISKHGSVAVATGYRSVARRLLDRLEHVFSRDLPAHGCSCIICEMSSEYHQGLNWGEVLEWVSGRVELPPWPPFDLASLGAKAAESNSDVPRRPASPVKLDPDIAEEFREHYLRQSKKVRHAVDKWLSNCAEAPAPPPQEVDDETLTFAILTNLEQDDRPFFNALFTGAKELLPATRAPTPFRKPRTDFLVKTGLSLQRLYQLQQTPRDAETAAYLIKNKQTHDLLVTMADINPSEWEILTSGRFDGFLWSGADGDDVTTPIAESRGATPASGFFPDRRAAGPRGATPASGFFPNPRGGPNGGWGTPGNLGSLRTTTPARPYSRGANATPASFVSNASSAFPNRQAVSNDEEAELAVLAELEREIYTGMEALEDAFETLHLRAEVVRTALRQRQSGLMQSLQTRRRIDVLPALSSGNSLGSGHSQQPAWVGASSDDDGTSESDWGADDFTELMPDDSASNISSSRHRRPKRRHERRTPAPIEEDEDEY